MEIVMRDPEETMEFKIAILLASVGIMIGLVSFIFNSPLAASISLLPLIAALIMSLWYLYCKKENTQPVVKE